MDFLRPGRARALAELRALVDVARGGKSGLARPQRALLEALQRRIFETDLALDDLDPIGPEAIARGADDPDLSRQLIRLMVVMSLVDGPPSAEQMSLLSAFSTALRVEEPAIDVIGHLARGRRARFRLAFLRRSHVRHYLRNTRRMEGSVLAVVRALLVFRGIWPEDRERAARYRAWADLPEDSLGHAFFEHCDNAGLPFPGEKGGFPAGALFHDFAHVLAGYDTTPEGELKVAAFQAGFTKDDSDFFTLLFAVLIHTAGINVAPFPMPVLPGRIGQDGLAMEIVGALERGAAMNTDLGDGWDFHEMVEWPIDDVRLRLGVGPARAA